MTMLPPLFPQSIRHGAIGFPDVEPFSIRSAASYEDIQYSIVTWIRDQLTPFLADNAAGPIWEANAAALTAAIDAALAGEQTAFATAYGSFIAPAPSGDTTGVADQAALQAILDAGKDLYLQPGHYYVTGLSTPNTATQPRIIGAGKTRTVLEAVGATNQVLRFGGPSGQVSGGGFEQLTIKGTGTVGVKIVGSCGIKWRRVLFDGNLTDAIQLFNDANGFTEFCSGEAEFTSAITGTALHYAKTASGNKSFHGSGLTEGSIINQSASAVSPAVVIDAGALPYNAPLTAQFFLRNASQVAVQNNNITDYVNFRGETTVEQFVDNCTVFGAADSTNWPVWHSGSLNAYGHVGLTVGACRFVDRIWTPAASGYPNFVRKPWQNSKPLTAGAFNLVTLPQRTSAMVSVRIFDSSGYEYDQLLYVSLRPNVSDGSGWVTVLATPRNADPGTKGAPAWSVSNGSLVVTNANYSSAFVATYSVQPLAPWVPLA